MYYIVFHSCLFKINLQFVSKLNRTMKEEHVTISPQIIEFNTQQHQTIKVTNNTSQPIKSCFFCLFNIAKFKFSPECFSLEPKQHKLITITLTLKNLRDSPKEFAYLKSQKINKRITIILNNMQSPERLSSQGEGVEELYTLSSRDYKNTQEEGFMKIITEKEKYIQILERQIQERESSFKKSNLTEKGKLFYIGQIESLQIKIDLLNRQKQELIRQNLLLQQKISQLETQPKTNKHFAFSSHEDNFEEIQYLEARCEEYLNTISEKEAKIRQLQSVNKNIQDELMKDNNERLRILEHKLEEQRHHYEESFQSYLSTIKELQVSASESQQFREKSLTFQRQLKSKDSEIEGLRKQLEKEKKKLQNEKQKMFQHEEEKKKLIKLNIVNSNLEEKNLELSSRLKDLQKANEDLRDQTSLYRSKIEKNETERVSHYLEVALDSCKTENQILKKNQEELEKSLAGEAFEKNALEEKHAQLKREINQMNEEINQLHEKNRKITDEKNLIKNENHENLMKLKTQNINLLEKINIQPSKSEEDKRKNEKILLLEKQLDLKKEECLERARKEEGLIEKIAQLEIKFDKATKKINKYKVQAKKELKNLNQITVGELKKVREEKNQLNIKLSQIQESFIHSQAHEKTRMKSKSKGDKPNRTPVHHARSESNKRVVGIKDQRKILEESRANSNHHEIDYEGLYTELGQLRELKNYLTNEKQKFQKIFGIGQQEKKKEDSKLSIFQTINFFKQLENKLNEGRSMKEKKQKEIENLKTKVLDLQAKNKEKMHEISEIEESRMSRNEKSLLEYIRDEMRSQYKKLHESLKLSNEKFTILKKKIYEEYRHRIVDLLSKKDKETIIKIQATLQRFIDGLSNTSHKEALLGKEVKLKQAARKQSAMLREKVQNLTQLLQTKKGYCSREPLKVFPCQNENQWFDNIKLQAQMLTYEAENIRLREQIDLEKNLVRNAEDELNNCIRDVEEKEKEIIKLKKEVIKVQHESEIERNKNVEEIQALRSKFIGMQKVESEVEHLINKEKDYHSMKEDLQRKKQLIKHLKEKEKMLEQLLESSQRNETNERERERKDINEANRVQQTLRDFKDSNRELRNENNRLKEKVETLEEEIQKKNSTIRRLKGDGEEHRIRTVKNEEIQSDKLRQEIKELKDELKKQKDQVEKIKKKKEREVTGLDSELQRIKNEHLIQIKSLESIVRALTDTLERIYSALELTLRKKSRKAKRNPDFEELRQKPGEVDSLKVYESFEEALVLLKED